MSDALGLNCSRQILLRFPPPLNRPLDPLADRLPVEFLLPAIEQIALRLMRQTEYPCKRKLDNYKAVEWAIAAVELGFPKETDGKRMVKVWRESRRQDRKVHAVKTVRGAGS